MNGMITVEEDPNVESKLKLIRADAYLKQLELTEHEKSAQRLKELDEKLAAKLSQVENIYQSRKEQWVDAIFDRIVGKAGG